MQLLPCQNNSMSKQSGKIGFFDFGLESLPVFKAVIAYLPQYEYEYFADTKNSKHFMECMQEGSSAEIEVVTEEGVRHLVKKGCVYVVLPAALPDELVTTLLRAQQPEAPRHYALIHVSATDADSVAHASKIIEAIKEHPALEQRLARGGSHRNIHLSQHGAQYDEALERGLR